MNPLQTVNYGTSFPEIKPSNGSIFIRTDLHGAKVFQYDAKNDVYVQLEGIYIKTFGSLNSTEECVDYYAQVFASMEGSSHAGPYYGYKGILTNKRYRYRLNGDYDRSTINGGYIDPVPYAPTYNVDGHRVCEIQWDPFSNTYKEVVVESSKLENPSYYGESVGTVISTLEGTNFPFKTTGNSPGNLGVSDHHITYSDHATYVLFNNLSDFGYSTLSAEEISIISGGTR